MLSGRLGLRRMTYRKSKYDLTAVALDNTLADAIRLAAQYRLEHPRLSEWTEDLTACLLPARARSGVASGRLTTTTTSTPVYEGRHRAPSAV